MKARLGGEFGRPLSLNYRYHLGQVPRDWWQVDSLAVNERGKLSRAEWRKRFMELTAAGENMP